MRTLDRKLMRDLWRLRAPLAAAALVMAAGVAALVTAWSTSASLRASRDAFYEEARFADVFVQLKRAPEAVAPRLAEIPGVQEVGTRVVHDVNLSVPGLADAANARIVSLPEGASRSLNGVHLRQGRMPEPRRAEVVVSEAFAAANRLLPGDTLGAVINGRWQTLTIVGVGLSPEFVYFVPPGSMLPDNRRSAVLWMPRSALAEALGMEGAFNDAVVRLSRDAEPRRVIAGIDALLDRYGGFGAYDRTDHVSDRYLRDEFDQLAVMGTLTPAIFLSVAAFLINVVLGRLVRTQREELATLRAFGYPTRLLARHVLLMALSVSVIASVVGVGAGALLGAYLSSFYVEVFRFPELPFLLDARAVAIGTGVALLASVGGVAGALRAVVRLAPSEAMRPESPQRLRASLPERLGVRLPAIRWRMAVRAVASHPWRSLFAAVGIGLSTAVLLVSSFPVDAVEFMIDREYSASQRQDLTVVFNEPVRDAGVHSLQGLLGGEAVLQAEPVRIAAVKLANAQIERTVAITGLEPGSELQRLLDREGRPVAVPTEGLLVSEHLAEVLRVKRGDLVHVRFLEGERVSAWVPVAEVFSAFVGLRAFMDRDALNRLARDGHVMSAVVARGDPLRAVELQERLRETPAVASVLGKRAMVDEFRAFIARNIVRITVLHAAFAAVIAFGVVYNTARVAFAERRRELATLRVLGFSRTEVSRMLFAEVAVLTFAGVPLGLVLGHGFAWALVAALQTESYEFPLIVSPRTYALSALVTVVAAVGSALLVRRGVARLDLLSTLKEAG